MNWLKKFDSQVRFKEPLSRHTTLQIGGPADAWIQPNDIIQLGRLIRHCLSKRIPYLILGRGSNILFTEQGFPGIVVRLNASAFNWLKIEGTRISCGAGLSLEQLIQQALRNGLSGLESLTGIPASVGGAIIMNAGSAARAIGDLACAVTVMDKKARVLMLERKRLNFGYRRSNLNRYIVLAAQFALSRRDPQKIKQEMQALLARKSKTQDLNNKSAGCIFKNPPHRLSAAEMIQLCGLKGKRRFGAQISKKHANYIINRAQAKSEDILYLMELAQEKVRNRFGVDLEPEIKIIR